ncbi:MAG TPA: GlsB/YeaQ/YmgE family stress response membrane protein [Stellaceae bacterium]|nr:GlsB/YeaQ/YmgE family stress response membrane protein [Stellaceae bacterium]
MYMSNESLLVIVVVGVIAGWLAGKIVDGGGFGFIGDLVVGIIGAFIGDWLLPRLNIHFGIGMIALIANATIGAIVLLVIIRVVAGARGWGGGWGNGWGGRWGRRW